MSAVLKSAGGDSVRAFSAPERARPDPMPDPRDVENARLAAQVVALQRQLQENAQSTADAVSEAREAGRRLGLEQAETRETDRLSALGTGIDAALDSWRTRLETLDGLAAALTQAALSKLFGQFADSPAPVTAMLARQLQTMRRAGIVAIHVNRHDFPDASALEMLARSLEAGRTPLTIETDAELAAGACRIEGRLEDIDLDLAAQWSKLSALLDDMAGGNAPA